MLTLIYHTTSQFNIQADIINNKFVIDFRTNKQKKREDLIY